MNKTAPLLSEQKFLTGQLLIAAPQIVDPRFSHTVILMCGHDTNGAMGIILNRLIDGLTLKDLLQQFDLHNPDILQVSTPIHFGGPVEMGRGFVLHSVDYLTDSSIKISNNIALSSTLEILSLVSQGNGPKEKIIALGYAGWSTGQLEAELQKNSWLQAEADFDIIFSSDLPGMWRKALNKLGVDPTLLSPETGHA
jgi:putative transcriptional regulator